MPDYESPSKWTPVLVHQSIDPILLNDRRVTISQEMQEAIRLDKGLARAEEKRRGNAGYYPLEWVRLEIRRTDEWAEKLANAWLEIWEIQGRAKCHALFRAIFDWELTQLFAARRACFQGESMQLEMTTGQPGRFSAARRHFAREMGKLISKWNRKLDVANREAMYKGVRAFQGKLDAKSLSSSPVAAPPLESVVPAVSRGTLSPSRPELRRATETMLTEDAVREVAGNFTWKELAERFRGIQAKTTPKRNASATFTRTEWDSGIVTEEWIVGGTNAACHIEFEHMASIAARKLGSACRENAYKEWLDAVLDWMERQGLDRFKNETWRPTGEHVFHGASGKSQTLYTEQIADLSARFCEGLIVHGTPESAVFPPSRDSKTLPKSSPTIANAKSRSKSRLNYRSDLKRAIQTELTKNPSATDRAVCQAIDSNGNAELPKNWQPKPGERSFEEAYMDNGKRPLIEKTISKVRADMRVVHLLPLK